VSNFWRVKIEGGGWRVVRSLMHLFLPGSECKKTFVNDK
jgi:hypothetical protein